MTLVQKQQTFVILISKLIDYCYIEKGWKLTFGECWRTPEQAKWNEAHGLGISHSLHTERLAIDLNLWVNDKLSYKVDDYKFLGNFWKELSTPDAHCCWGGDFHHLADIYHFSIEHLGIK